MNVNPYAPPTVDVDAPAPSRDGGDARAQREEHFRPEGYVRLVGTLLLCSGLTQLPALSVYLPTSNDPIHTALQLCSASSRIAAGLLLWRLHPIGRWLHLAGWGSLLAIHTYFALRFAEYADPTRLAAFAVIAGAGLVILWLLWGERGRPVFERAYRETIVPATRGQLRRPLRHWLLHAAFVALCAVIAVKNLS